MDKFYKDCRMDECEHLLQATPYTKQTQNNFGDNLTKEEFFKNLYAERSRKPEFIVENDLFDNRIEQVKKNLNNRFNKVSMVHIAGYAGCGKTTYIHHLLWSLRDEIGTYDVVDYESCKRAVEPFINRTAKLIYERYDVCELLDYFEKINSLTLYNVNRFREQLPLLKEFSVRLEELHTAKDSVVEDSYRILLELYEDDYTTKRGGEYRAKKNFVSFLLFLEFILLLLDRFRKMTEYSMFLVIDNADSLSDPSEESMLLEAIKKFENDCDYFFSWNLKNESTFNGIKVSDVLENTRLSMFFTTRIATIKKYESLDPDGEKLNGWTSLQFPAHYYDHKEIIDHRVEYYLSLENPTSELAENLHLVKKLSEVAYSSYNFMRLFNGNYRVCIDKICDILNMVQKDQIQEMLGLYAEKTENPDAVEGVNGYFLYMILFIFKYDNVYSEVLDLSPCRKDGTISLSRMVMTILREKGDRCSLLDLLELLTPIGFNANRVCTQLWKLSEVSRNHGWRRLLLFDVIVPSSLEELKKQATNYDDGDRNVANYSELIICTAGQAYMEFVVPHFEFMLSRHEMGVGISTHGKYQPLFARNSEQNISNSHDKVLYRFEKKIELVYKDVEDCCHNSMAFADRVQKYFKITRGEYIYSTYYNYHPVGWNHDVGPKQSYESRLIFRHIGYIEKYRRYLLNKRKELPFAQRVDINRRLITWIVKYLKLYQNSHKCYQTEIQNVAADALLELAKSIGNSGFADFTTRIELND